MIGGHSEKYHFQGSFPVLDMVCDNNDKGLLLKNT